MQDRTNLYERLKKSTSSNYTRRDNQPSIMAAEQYMNQVAKVRLLEDQMFSERLKIDSLEKKAQQYINSLQKCEIKILDLEEALMRANRQIQHQMLKNSEIQSYELSMKEITLQITSLNEALIQKNNDYNKLVANTKKIIAQNQELRNIIKKRDVRLKQIKSQSEKLLKICQSNGDITFGDQQIQSDLRMLEQYFLDLKQKLMKTKNQFEKNRKQASQSSIKQKQEVIKLEYALKLAQNRGSDLQKRKYLQTSFAVDQKTQQIIQQMLKKQDQIVSQLQRLQIQNQQLKENFELQIENRNHYQKIKTKELQAKLLAAEKKISDLEAQKSKLKISLQQLQSYSQLYTSRSAQEEAELSKRYRQCQQENKRLHVQVLELKSDSQILKKQLTLRFGQPQTS